MSDTASARSIPAQSEKPVPVELEPELYDAQFTDTALASQRALYMKMLGGGLTAMVVVIFAFFSIYWGALWKVPAHQLDGWVVNLDSGAIGTAVTQGLLASASSSTINWHEMTGMTADEVGHLVLEQKTWVAVVVNAGSSDNLNNATADYDPTTAVTMYGVEARSENAYRSLIRPVTQAILITISQQFAQERLPNMSSDALASLASTSPQAITNPISYTIVNLAAFDIPVATAITFVGLIYLLILSFFIVMIGGSAREVSGLEKRLTTASLIRVRIVSVFVAYFFISLFYSLLSLAFQVDFSRKFGHSGFLVFWMINFSGMLSVGLALEAMITILTIRFVPFFMILWIVSNVSVCFMPIDVLPTVFRYGYAMPFYNVSLAVRTILFGTKNLVGMNFGILLAWAVISMITLPLFQWYMRRSLVRAPRA